MNGLTNGLKYMSAFLKLFILAIRHGNTEAITDGVSVAEQWVRETVTEAGGLRVSGLSLLLGADPWQASRKMQQAYSLKWTGRL